MTFSSKGPGSGSPPSGQPLSAFDASGERRKVAIVVLTWNAFEYSRRCLETLRDVTSHPRYRVIVVDNGSTDDTVGWLREQSWLTAIYNPKNLGFTRGVNIGLDATEADEDVVLMNNDIFVDDPEWLDRLQDVTYSDPKVAVAGTRLVDPEGRINHLGSYMQPVTLYGQQIGGLERDVNQCIEDTEAECVVFAMAYMRRDAIDALGPLDEDLFAYFEDTEWCFRATSSGWKVMYAGSVCPVHNHNTSTKANKVDFWTGYLKSRKTFERKWGKWVEHERYDSELVWHSVVHRPLGYALHSRKMMKALHFAGTRVSFKNAYGEHDQPTDDLLINDLMDRKVSRSVPHVAYAMAEAFPKIHGKLKVGWTMLEVTGLPDDWVAGCNHMDEIWVPASFNVETFKNSGVRVPVRTMPLGVDTGYFHPKIQGFRPSDKFTFLSVFEWGERKAPEILLRAFADEFKPSDDAVLVVSVFNRDPEIDVATEIKKLDLPESAQIVVLENPEFVDHQMGSLYRSADCFVLPTRGEGWGVPVMEAMACGLPTIATGWSGPADFMPPGTGYAIDYTMVPAEARCAYYEGFDWAEPSYEHLRALMRQVYSDPEAAGKVGSAAAAHIQQNYTWDKVAQQVRARLAELTS